MNTSTQVLSKKELWLRLKRYSFEHVVPPNLWDKVRGTFSGTNAATQAFAAKIAAKHGWSRGFTLQALHEYKKYIYLGVVADFIVTPSKHIDIVWHEHLLFSKAYRVFCHDIICYDFDHNPELLPTEEQTRVFQEQYFATLELYSREFDSKPPAAIWGSPKFNSEETGLNKSTRKKKVYADGGDPYADSWSLSFYFNGNSKAAGFDFEGGDFGGAGAGGSWDSGSDSGDSSSGCSSGCGGGCGGD